MTSESKLTYPNDGSAAADNLRRTAENSPYGPGRLAPPREEIEAAIRARGHSIDAAGRSVFTTPARTADEYRDVNMAGLPLPDGVDEAAATQRAKDLGLALGLDPMLASAVGKDLAHAGKVDPDAVRAVVNRVDDYDDLIRLAAAALGRNASRLGSAAALKATDLPPASLVHIGQLERLAIKRGSQK
jgi:hypothetical protein